MDDQRIEARPGLRLEDPCHGPVVRRIGPEPVDRLGRKGDQPTLAQKVRGAGQPGGIGGEGKGAIHVTQRWGCGGATLR